MSLKPLEIALYLPERNNVFVLDWVWVFYLGGELRKKGWGNRRREKQGKEDMPQEWIIEVCNVGNWGLDSIRTSKRHGMPPRIVCWEHKRLGFYSPLVELSICPQCSYLPHISGLCFQAEQVPRPFQRPWGRKNGEMYAACLRWDTIAGWVRTHTGRCITAGANTRVALGSWYLGHQKHLLMAYKEPDPV